MLFIFLFIQLQANIITSVNWSPDGQSIVFIKSVDKTRQVFSKKIDQEKHTQLTRTLGDKGFPAYSANGKKLAYLKTVDSLRQIFICDVNGENERQLTFSKSNKLNPSWANSDRDILFSMKKDGFSGIYSISTNSKEIKLVSGENYNLLYPKQSPDGDYIAVTGKKENQGTNQIYIFETGDFSSIRNVTNNLYHNYNQSWSASSKQLIYVTQYRRELGSADIHLIDIQNGRIRQITKKEKGTFQLKWRPGTDQVSYRYGWIKDYSGWFMISLSDKSEQKIL